MEGYRGKLKRKIRWTALAYGAFLVAAVAYLLLRPGLNGQFASAQVGSLCGMSVAVAAHLIRWGAALRSPEKLEALSRWDNDERLALIYQKVGISIINIVSLLLVAGLIVTASVNATVCFTLLGVLLTFLAAYLLLYLYYSKKY